MAIAVPGDPPAGEESVGMAVIFEALFKRREQSLHNPETAAAFRASLEAFLVLLKASADGGVISAEQYRQLGATLGLADRFPDLI